MPRRKRGFIEDEDPDSSGGDSDEEGDDGWDGDDAYKRKKRQRRKGMFDEDGDEEEEVVRRSDWTRAPEFTAGEGVNLTEEMDVELENQQDKDDEEDEDEEEEEDSSSGEDESPSPPPTQDQVEEDVEEQEVEEPPPRMGIGGGRGGIGMGSAKSMMDQFTSSTSTSTLPTATSSFGSRGGIGSSNTTSSTARTSFFNPPPSQEPPSFRPTVQIDKSAQAMFSKHTTSGSVGARMMEKMGYTAGTGLGLTGEGIVNPIESKQRPVGIGMGYKGFDERTEQSKKEEKRKARREGKYVSDDDDDDPRKKKGRGKGKMGDEGKKKASDAWKRPAKRKVKIQHKTYEEILAESSASVAAPVLPEKIIDATGAEMREVSSISSLPTWTPTSELSTTRLPEIRHNLRLICDSCKTDMDGLAREARSVEERKKWIAKEDERLAREVVKEADLIKKLQDIHLVVDEIDQRAKSVPMTMTTEASLDVFEEVFEKLFNQSSGGDKEFEKYRLDEVIVGAIAPTMKKIVASWNPLQDPSLIPTTTVLRRWRIGLKATYLSKPEKNQLLLYGNGDELGGDNRFGTRASVVIPDEPMTPYESLIWNIWMPKVRSAINNEWDPTDASPAIALYETWSDLLPLFIRDNFMDQLILPKVQNAIAQWSPKKRKEKTKSTATASLQGIVFPWLPHLGLRMEEVIGEARRKVKSLFRAWVVNDGLPEELLVWKKMFDPPEWENLQLKYVIPKLASTLRSDDFIINPADQDMQPFKYVMEWSAHIRSSTFSRIIEETFFPKWLEVLYTWLVQPGANYVEVGEWYEFWRDEFPEEVRKMDGVQRGLICAQQMMHDATTTQRGKLRKPDFDAIFRQPQQPAKQPKPPPSIQRPKAVDITFKSIVEEQAAQHNLLFIPTGRTHEKSRMPLYRVSANVDGKGGIDVFIMDDAVWVVDGQDYRAVGLDDMVLRATRK